MHSYAVLVDGGFIRRRLGSQAAPFAAQDFSDFASALHAHPHFAEHTLHRIYFYDAAPLTGQKKRPLQGGTEDFGQNPVAAQSKALHDALVRQPNVALRLGELAFRDWKLRQQALPPSVANTTISAAQLVPDIQQKGVDMRIGLDIAALTLKRFVSSIVLVTADSDFVPAMKFARREGARLYLVPLGNPIKDTMLEHSDVVVECVTDPHGVPIRPVSLK
jgi:uncharacterized LabA/DUF88 family protein